MTESNKPNSATKDKLIADLKHLLADAEALLQATSDQAGEKIAGLRTRLQDNLKTTQDRLAEFAATNVDKTRQDVQDALQKISDAATQAAEAAGEAAHKAEESVKKASESGKEAAQHAAAAAQQAVAATKTAADKALKAMQDWRR
ncbi:DUF883 domain-containing protein [Hydrogenophaga sp.]|uniref:DUF883 family protein n=1 Tax=Hydrogenophaga sp. TaxID=1904254 RepID=UPI00198786D1|nr:DUF883 domain-containing protein [Hydrogenophaga sp.]MBD3893875.1 hypothetical protein [Hydrogenophaga sp.]